MEEIFMVWSEENEQLVRRLDPVVSKIGSNRIKLHIFIPRNSTSIPRVHSWTETHESLTSQEDAAKISMIVFILQKFDLRAIENGKDCSRRRSSPTKTIYLVQNENEDYTELLRLLQSSCNESMVDLKLLLINSVDFSEKSAEKRRCKHCKAFIHEVGDAQWENSSVVKSCNGFKSNGEATLVNEKSSSPIEKQSRQEEGSLCFVCGRYRNQQTLAHKEDINLRFSRHFKSKESDGTEKNGKLQFGIQPDAERKENDNYWVRNSMQSFLSCSPCNCLRGSMGDAIECKSCKERLQRYGSDGLTKERSKSSEEYKAGENCHCSREGISICVSCLLAKLARPLPELKLGRSESAPGIFFHGEFKDCCVDTHKMTSTLEKGTSVDDDLQAFNRVTSMEKSTEVKIPTCEKWTNTRVEKPAKVMFEKSTSTDDLEKKVERKDLENHDTRDASYPLPSDNKKSFLYSCTFCPEKGYRSKNLLDVHMKNNHKKCNCPCQQYFRTREDYLAHFYFVYPLPCMVDKKCPERFRSLYYQSLHHKDVHYANKPFFCIPCYKINGDNARIASVFKDIASLRIHGTSHGHDSRDMYLASIDDNPDDSNLPFSMRCSGINYC